VLDPIMEAVRAGEGEAARARVTELLRVIEAMPMGDEPAAAASRRLSEVEVPTPEASGRTAWKD
jgi:hypothetical protein